MTMGRCTEEEQEEFFETLEAISASSPLSESEAGEDERYRLSAAEAESSVQCQQMSPSNYEIWQSQTSSIFERRQRLFSNMGIRLGREGSKRESESPKFAEQRSWGGCVSREGVESGSENRLVSFPNLSDSLETQQSITNGEVPSGERVDHVQAVALMTSTNGRHITTCVPVHSRENSSIEVDKTSSFRAAPSSSGQSFSAPRSASQHSVEQNIGIDRSQCFQEGTILNQFNNEGTFKVLPDYARLLEEDYNVSMTQSRQNGVMLSDGRVVSQSMQGIELLCRIKDLDSGKEFIVNAGGKDDPWNKVKELKTGQELTPEEFQSSLGFSPLVHEVMRREQVSDYSGAMDAHLNIEAEAEKKWTWFKAIKGFVKNSRDKHHHKGGSNDRLPSLEKSGRRSSADSNDSQDSAPQVVKRMKVHAHKKRTKDLSDLYLRQEIQAHEGAIWTMKFNFDGTLLASAGQDKMVRVWEAAFRRENQSLSDITVDSFAMTERITDGPLYCRNQSRGSMKEIASTPSSPSWSSKPFLLLEKPKHVFGGHLEDVLDLSWSQTQSLLSSSMDKTVRLWDVMSGKCLRIFAHNDYVTCIHFNPVDDGYFISGSLDGKVRIWSIKDRQVVDWVDLCEMVTAACYMQNGQGAIVGSYTGTCHFYKTIDSKLQFDQKFQVQRKREKRSQRKKITGFQFVPNDDGKLLITSSDSRIRVYDGSKVCSKYIGLRNSNSQISASFSSNGTFVICASEDSSVCIWNYYDSSLHSFQKQKSLSRSYEHFFVQSVSIAIPWPGSGLSLFPGETKSDRDSEIKATNIADERPYFKMTCKRSLARDKDLVHDDINEHPCDKIPRQEVCDSDCKRCFHGSETILTTSSMLDSYLEDCCLALSEERYDEPNGNCANSLERECAGLADSWLPSGSLDRNPNHEEKVAIGSSMDSAHRKISGVSTAWGLVIVTASLGGEIQVFQNAVPA